MRKFVETKIKTLEKSRVYYTVHTHILSNKMKLLYRVKTVSNESK